MGSVAGGLSEGRSTRWIALLLILAFASALETSRARALPDNRAYELVTPVEKNGVTPGAGLSAVSGSSLDWFGLGGLGDATSGATELYQSRRTSTGWQTTALTPAPLRPELGLFEEQAPVFWSGDLSRTVFTTAQEYAPGDTDGGALDLYLAGPEGKLTWISQGSQGGSGRDEVTYDAATRDAGEVAFSTSEPLTPDAVGLEPEAGNRAVDYLYVRDVADEKTTLVNVNDADQVINPEGAILGAGDTLATGEPPARSFLPADVSGTTTHAISNDGSKVFFETPPPDSAINAPPHLYVREDSARTVALDNPAASGSARYEGAAEDGSRAFFTSDEGLAGDSFTDKELYEFDAASEATIPISAGASDNVDGDVLGVTAIANDGSRVYFVARGVLTPAANARGQSASEGQPNFYVYDTRTSVTSFITTLALGDVEPEPQELTGPLVVEPDTSRAAQPTPDGAVLIFDSSGDLTGENPTNFFEVYRYDASSGSLICVSCLPGGAPPSAPASISAGGGTYDPAGQVSMNETGSEVFFTSPDALVPEDVNSQLPKSGLRTATYDVYEWENGHVALISPGQASLLGSILDGTTPSGDDVFFTSADSLVPQDNDGGNLNIYDARVNGGFPAVEPPSPCSGDGCREVFAPPPALATPGSALLQEASSPAPVLAVAPRRKAKPHKAKTHKPKAKTKRKRHGKAKSKKGKRT